MRTHRWRVARWIGTWLVERTSHRLIFSRSVAWWYWNGHAAAIYLLCKGRWAGKSGPVVAPENSLSSRPPSAFQCLINLDERDAIQRCSILDGLAPWSETRLAPGKFVAPTPRQERALPHAMPCLSVKFIVADGIRRRRPLPSHRSFSSTRCNHSPSAIGSRAGAFPSRRTGRFARDPTRVWIAP